MLQPFKRQGIRGKIITGYISIFIITCFLGGAFTYYYVKKNITIIIQNQLKNSTDSVLGMVRTAAGVSVKNYLRAVSEKNIQTIQAIYKRYRSGSISEREAKEEARRILFSQTIGKTGYVYCVNSRGNPVEHPNPDVVGKMQWAQEPFVRKMIKMKQGYMEYDWKNPGESHYRPKAVYMNYFKPWDWILAVSTYTEELKDLINVDDFKQNVLALKFGKTGYSYIIDGQGNPIIHPKFEGSLTDEIRNLDKDNIINDILRLKNGTLTYSWKDSPEGKYRKKLVIFNNIPEYDWYVASSGYFDEFFSILSVVKRIIILSILTMVVLGFLSTIWLSRLVIEPLNRLMDRLSLGVSENLAIRMPVTSIDEIGKLIAYFNDFMEKLEKYSNDLKKEISEHRQTAEALMESEWRYRTILKCMDEGYCETDLKGNIILLNNSMKLISGYSKTELMGKNILDIIPKQNFPLLSDIYDGKGIKNYLGRIYELELPQKDGSIRFLETTLSIKVNNYAQPFGIRFVMRDVTSKVLTQNALRQSEEMFSKSFQCSPSGMFLAQIENGRIINVNDRFLNFTGYDFGDVEDKTLLELNFFKNKKEAKRFIKLINKKQRIQSREIEFLTSSGDVRDGILSVEELQIGGENCILAALEDHTEIRQMERQFIDITENQRQEIAFALHDDLCPQLIGIDMLFAILKSKLSRGLPEQISNIEKIETLIQDSIKKTRLLSRGLCPVDIINQGFDASLSELCGYVEDMFGISCQQNSDSSNPFTDNTAATHAYYIAHEAVHNAVKHAGSSKITIHFLTRNEKAVLMIKDNGTGLNLRAGQKGMGIKIMTYRARLLNAFLDIYHRPGGGTIVLLEMDSPVAMPNQKGKQA